MNNKHFNRHLDDVKKLATIYKKEKLTAKFKLSDIYNAWSDFSDTNAAGWSGIEGYCDSTICMYIDMHIKEEEEDFEI